MLLLEANRHSPGPERDLSREVHKAEWRIKEQKLKDDIRSLREKLTGLVRAGKGWVRLRACRAKEPHNDLLELQRGLKIQFSRIPSA